MQPISCPVPSLREINQPLELPFLLDEAKIRLPQGFKLNHNIA